MADQDPDPTVLALTEAIGPATAFLARRLFDQANREACQRCLDLLCCARSFTPTRVERAALRLMDYGVQDVAALRFLLEHELDALVHREDTELDGQLGLGLTGAESSQQT
jgi:hypothetical protein